MFDVKDDGADEFARDLDIVMSNFPKETRQILQRAGTKARTIVARHARGLVGKKTGNYHKRWKRGKVWTQGPDYKIRIYNNAPHAHLLEDGHRIVGKDGSEHGFKEGYKVMDKANAELEKEWESILQTEMDKMLDKL